MSEGAKPRSTGRLVGQLVYWSMVLYVVTAGTISLVRGVFFDSRPACCTANEVQQ